MAAAPIPRATELPHESISCAFFDVDRTILSGDSSLHLAGVLRKRGLLTRRQLLRAMLVHVRLLAGVGTDDATNAFEEVMRVIVRGWSHGEVAGIVTDAFEQVLRPVLFSQALQEMESHRAAGRMVVLASASPTEIVLPLAAAIGADAAIASEMEVVDGYYTGDFEHACFGEGKALLVRKFAQARGIDLARSHAYSDSHTDVPFLEACGTATCVNPDRRLARHARAAGWEIVRYRTS